MIPTIDISVLGLLSALGAFLAWLWQAICRVYEWCQSKFVLFWLGHRVGRGIAEFAIFAFAYTCIVSAISVLLEYAIAGAVEITVPSEVRDTWRVFNVVFPVADLVSCLEQLATYYASYLIALGVYSHFHRIFAGLLALRSTGRI